jgi:hypothetical protein
MVTNRLWASAVLAVSLAGCGAFGAGAKSPERVRLECHAAALAPYVEPLGYDAVELMRDVYAGRVNLNALADALHLSDAAKEAYNAAVSRCEPQAPVDLVPEGATQL